MELSAHTNVDNGFTISATRYIQFQYAETNPDIVSANVNIDYYVNHHEGQVDTSYGFYVWMDAIGDFSGMDVSDITVTADGTPLSLDGDSFNIDSNGCNSYHINVWAPYTGDPILGEYIVEIRDSVDQITSYTIGTLVDYPQKAPDLTYPTHCELITNQTPTFTWDAYSFTYDGTPLIVQDYSLDLSIYNGDVYNLWVSAGQTSEGYGDHEWWNHNTQQNEYLPPLPVGGHNLNLAAYLNTGGAFNFWVNRYIQFQYGETNPDIASSNIHINCDVNYDGNSQLNTSYGLNVWVDAIGDFSGMNSSDITVTANGTPLSLDGNSFSADQQGVQPLPYQYLGAVRGRSDSRGVCGGGAG